MILEVDIFRAIVEYRILGKRESSLIIEIHHHSMISRNSRTLEELHYPHRFLRNVERGDILCFSERERHASLLLRLPNSSSTPYLDNIRLD